MIKLRGVDLGKNEKTLWGIFKPIISHHKIENRTYRKNAKNDIEIAQNGLPSPREHRRGIPNVSKSGCHQNLFEHKSMLNYLIIIIFFRESV